MRRVVQGADVAVTPTGCGCVGAVWEVQNAHTACVKSER
jgi:hypothetical protein